MLNKRKNIVIISIVALIVVIVGASVGSRILDAKADMIEAEKVAAFETEEIAKIDASRLRNFRDVYWGMTAVQVKASETWELLFETDDMISYDGEIFNVQCDLTYVLTGPSNI